MTNVLTMLTGSPELWTTVSTLLLDVAVKGVFLLLVASALAVSLRRSSAATRHLVWCVAVFSLLALPVGSVIVPKWTIPGMPSISFAAQTRELPAGDAGRMLDVGHVAIAPEVTAQVAEVSGEEKPRANVVPTAGNGAGEEMRSEVAPLRSEKRAVQDSGIGSWFANLNWTVILPALWSLGAFIVLAWIVGGLLRSWLLIRSAREIEDGSLAWIFDELSEELELGGKVALLQAPVHTMPMAWGVRPCILLPADAGDWTDARLRAVLLHELAHVKRRDYLTQLVARLAGALHWFNPLAWFAIHRMRVERELACDDRVLSTGSKASDYAGHLLDIARDASAVAFASVGGVAMARRSKLSDRLLAVLDDTRRRASVTPRMAATAWAGAASLLLPVAGAGFPADADTAKWASTDSTAPATPAAAEFEAVEVAPATIHSQADSRPVSPLAVSTPAVTTVRSQAGMSSLSRTRIQPLAPPAPGPTSVASTQTRCDWYDRDADASVWMSGEDDQIQLRIATDNCRLDVDIDGDIFFNQSETDIVDISPRGYFEMEEREGRFSRRLVIEPVGRGELARRWYVDGDEHSYDRAAADWLQEMIPVLFRRVGLQAEERARRILQGDGVEGVLDEISLIPSDYISRKYYQVILTEGDLDNTQLRSVVRQAGDEIESDYELAQLLVEVAENHPVDESVMLVYVEAAGSLESDYEQRRVLDTILSRQDLSPAVAEEMLRLATDLESDYELAELLIAILERHPVHEALTNEFFAAVNTLDSDYEHNRVLKFAIHEGAPSEEVLDLALGSAENIDSDYERAELLLEVARLYPVGETIPSFYLDAARSLDSDYELGRVLKFLIDNHRLSEEALESVLDASLTIESDYELAGMLLGIVNGYELSESEREVYFHAVSSIDSDYELGRVLSAIVEMVPLTQQNLSAVLTTSRQLESDYELANLLIAVAVNHRLDEDLRALYMNAVDTISSNHERGRVLSALMPRGQRRN